MSQGPPRLLVFLINMIISIVEFLLAFRIMLKFFGANPVAPFVMWVYETTEPLLNPFEGIFPSPELEGGLIIEFSAVFALMVYALVGYLLMELIEGLTAPPPSRTNSQ